MKNQKQITLFNFLILCLLALFLYPRGISFIEADAHASLNSPLTGASSTPPISAWVIRWHIDTPEEIAKVCREAEGNFTSLLVQARGRADAYYQSKFVHRAEELAGTPDDFDPLAEVLEKCRSQKIQAWLNVYYLWTGDELPKNSNHPAQPDNPWILEDNSGRKVTQYSPLEQAQNWIEGTYADPASDEYQQLFINVVDEVVSTYQLDGIHLDFLRYPGAAFGYGGNLAAEFQRQWNFDPRFLPAELSNKELKKWYDGSMQQKEHLLVTGALLWAEMRANKITELVRRLRKKLDETNPHLKLSAAVFPDYLDAYLKKGQDWQRWATDELVDELYPMAYFGETERVTRQLKQFTQATDASKVKIWAGLGAYIKTVNEIKDETLEISSLPLEGISLFSLGHLQKKKGKIPPYTKAIRQSFRKNDAHGANKQVHNVNDDIFVIIENFQNYVRKNNFGVTPADPIILERIKAFSTASQNIIPQLIKKMQETEQTTPPWVEMHGIFRFVHPFDSSEKKQDQFELIKQAKKEMETGASMRKISNKLSQAGSRRLSSILPRHYLNMNMKKDYELAGLRPGEVSKIYKVDNGYWCYKIIKKGERKTADFAETTWPAKRILFRQRLLNL